MATCPNCGKSTPEGKFCEHCGASMQTAQTFQQPVAQPVYTPQPVAPARGEKNAFVALVLSFLFLGSGQVYNGQTGKGIGFLIGLILICWIPVVPLLLWIYCLYDAYSTAQKMNKGEVPYAETSWGMVIGFIVVEIIIAVIIFLFLFALIMGSGGYYY